MSENLNITNREDIFLAKIAGRDVDISTMTPPVANGVHEKLLGEIADRIDGVAENSLPEIEAGDEGKVLGVSEGQYALVPGGGGGGGSAEPFVVTYDTTTEKCDASYNEIKAAVESGRMVTIKYVEETPGDTNTTTTFDFMCLMCLLKNEYDDDTPTDYSAEFFNMSVYAEDPDEDMYAN